MDCDGVISSTVSRELVLLGSNPSRPGVGTNRAQFFEAQLTPSQMKPVASKLSQNPTVACTRIMLAIVLPFSVHASLRAEVFDLTGGWAVAHDPVVKPSSSPFEDWLRALPKAVFSLSQSVIPPLAMIREDLGYTYSPSQPSTTISGGSREKPTAVGFLQNQSGRQFEGELAAGECWMHLSLELSEDGSTLSGSARINTKFSTRQCRNSLAKEVKNGQPFPYGLTRLK
jgi:hypothetical protein